MELKIKVDTATVDSLMEDYDLTATAFQLKLQERIDLLFESMPGLGTDFELWLGENLDNEIAGD